MIARLSKPFLPEWTTLKQSPSKKQANSGSFVTFIGPKTVWKFWHVSIFAASGHKTLEVGCKILRLCLKNIRSYAACLRGQDATLYITLKNKGGPRDRPSAGSFPDRMERRVEVWVPAFRDENDDSCGLSRGLWPHFHLFKVRFGSRGVFLGSMLIFQRVYKLLAFLSLNPKLHQIPILPSVKPPPGLHASFHRRMAAKLFAGQGIPGNFGDTELGGGTEKERK